jgi:hypothetical protein
MFFAAVTFFFVAALACFHNWTSKKRLANGEEKVFFRITLMDPLCECIDPAKWHINSKLMPSST